MSRRRGNHPSFASCRCRVGLGDRANRYFTARGAPWPGSHDLDDPELDASSKENAMTKLQLKHWLYLLTLLAIPFAVGPTAVNAAPQTSNITVPSAVPPGTQDTPLPDARAAAITTSAIYVSPGDVVQIVTTGTVNGGPGFRFFDANGAPSGSQSYSGPASGGGFATIVGPSANIYSLIGRIDSDHQATLTDINDEWFLVGTSLTLTASHSGQLIFMCHDKLSQADWAPAYLDNTGSFNASITIPSPDDQLTTLRESVQGVGPGNSLFQKLGAALDALARGNTGAACDQLQAFINEVNAQSGKSISTEQAQALVGKAAQIRAALGCS
jgi:hypothetical protein